MNIINCTPHALVIITPEGEKKIFEPSGIIPRVTMETVSIDTINGIPVKHLKYGEVTGLPEPTPETVLIVSAMVAQVSDRDDLIAPDTGAAIRDEKGNIIGVAGFVKY